MAPGGAVKVADIVVSGTRGGCGGGGGGVKGPVSGGCNGKIAPLPGQL